jgi:hypothetical protein
VDSVTEPAYWDPHFAESKAAFDALGEEIERSLATVDHEAERAIFNRRCQESLAFAETMAWQFYRHPHWYEEKP